MNDSGLFQNLKNVAKLKDVLRDAGGMQEQFEKMNQELAARTVEGNAGAGAVRVVMNGKMEVVRVHLDRPLLSAMAGAGDETDQSMMEELIAAATNDASAKAREVVGEEMQRITGGFDLPGLSQLMK